MLVSMCVKAGAAYALPVSMLASHTHRRDRDSLVFLFFRPVLQFTRVPGSRTGTTAVSAAIESGILVYRAAEASICSSRNAGWHVPVV